MKPKQTRFKSIHFVESKGLPKGVFACGVYTKAWTAAKNKEWISTNNPALVTCGRCYAQWSKTVARP